MTFCQTHGGLFFNKVANEKELPIENKSRFFKKARKRVEITHIQSKS